MADKTWFWWNEERCNSYLKDSRNIYDLAVDVIMLKRVILLSCHEFNFALKKTKKSGLKSRIEKA